MTEKKPPLGGNGQLLGEFAQALLDGRPIDPNGPKGTPDPALLKTLGALEGGDAHFANPMKGAGLDGEKPSEFQFNKNCSAPKK